MTIRKILAAILAALSAAALISGCAAEKGKEDLEPEIDSKVVVLTENFVVSQSMMEYFFNSYYRTFIKDYATRLSQMNLDTGKSLQEQKYSEEYSWFDYLIAQTLRQVQQLLYLNEAALEADMKLSEESLQEIENNLTRYDSNAAENGTSTAFYIKKLFGNAVNETTIRKCLELQMLAAQYKEKLEAEQEYTEADLEAYFTENSNDYSMIGLICATVPRDRAQAFVDAENEDAFVRLLREWMLEEEPGLSEEDLADKVEGAYVRRAGYVEGADFSEWAFDPQRAAYDTYAAEKTEDGKTVVYMLLPAVYEPLGEVLFRDDTPMKNLQYILFESDEKDASNTSKDKAQAVYDTWKKESDPRGAFDLLMREYGGDTSLDLERGKLAADLENWIFDKDRKEGDVNVITVTEGTYFLYMLADGDLQWKTHVRADMYQEALDESLRTFAKQYDVQYDADALYDIDEVSISDF